MTCERLRILISIDEGDPKVNTLVRLKKIRTVYLSVELGRVKTEEPWMRHQDSTHQNWNMTHS